MNHIKRSIISMLEDVKYMRLPISFEQILRYHSHIALVPFSVFMKDFNLTLKETLKLSNTENACCVYNPKRGYIIYYNDLNEAFMKSYRYRFSIAHELGHIFMEHLTDERTRIIKSGLTDLEYSLLEREADKFASYLLCPYSALKGKKVNDYKDIQRICNASAEASKIAYKNLEWWLRNRGLKNISDLTYDILFMDDYDDWINSKFPQETSQVDDYMFSFSMDEFKQLEDEHFDSMLENYLSKA